MNIKSILLTLTAAFLLIGCVCQKQQLTYENINQSILVDNLRFAEGPVYTENYGLLYSDVHGKTIGNLQDSNWFAKEIKTNGLANGIADNKLYACCYSLKSLLEIDLESKSYAILSDRYENKTFNNVNDIEVDKDGYVYFSDPKWGSKKSDRQGIFTYHPSKGICSFRQINHQPNGVALNSDHTILYVARSGNSTIMAYQLAEGKLTEEITFHTLPKGSEPDGMTVDANGNLYIALAGSNKLAILSKQGILLKSEPVIHPFPTNCAFDKNDHNCLYLTCGGRKGKFTGAVLKINFAK